MGGKTESTKAESVKKTAASKSSSAKAAVTKTAAKPAAKSTVAKSTKSTDKTTAKTKASSTAATSAAARKTVSSAKTSAVSRASSKKPVAGIDENGTFRAWDNAKTKAAPKKAGEEKTAVKRGTTAEQAAKKLAEAQAIDPNARIVTKTNAAYDDAQIKHLDALEHIRLRSGMYIGRLGDGSNQNDGIYVLLKEIIDNSIDEYIMGNGNRIDIQILENRVKVRLIHRGQHKMSVPEM